jgi:hypothetical protein
MMALALPNEPGGGLGGGLGGAASGCGMMDWSSLGLSPRDGRQSEADR